MAGIFTPLVSIIGSIFSTGWIVAAFTAFARLVYGIGLTLFLFLRRIGAGGLAALAYSAAYFASQVAFAIKGTLSIVAIKVTLAFFVLGLFFVVFMGSIFSLLFDTAVWIFDFNTVLPVGSVGGVDVRGIMFYFLWLFRVADMLWIYPIAIVLRWFLAPQRQVMMDVIAQMRLEDRAEGVVRRKANFYGR